MGKDKKVGKGRLDKYYHLAKSQGYRARSAFKLIQLNKKYGFLEKARVLVDLCASPGSWLQVASKYMPVSSIIIGVDLVPIKPIPRVITHTEDITTASCQSTIQKDLKTWKADVVLHDGAPNVGSSWIQDAYDQSVLVLCALKLATDILTKGGTFVTKVFRSRDYNKLLWILGQFFDKVEATKPPSSRNVSAELFVVCRGFLAPKKIDARLLDPKYVFQEVDDAAIEDAQKDQSLDGGDKALPLLSTKSAMDELMNPVKNDKKRKREGYEDGNQLLFKKTSVLDFLNCKKDSEAVQILASYNQLSFEEQADKIVAADDDEDEDDHQSAIALSKVLINPLTTPEIQSCCADLKVLGRKEYRHLLKWRKNIRALLLSQQQQQQEDANQDEVKESSEVNNSDELKKEITEIEALEEMVAKEIVSEKRKKKKRLEKLAKDRRRIQLNMITPQDIALDAANDSLAFADEFNLDGAEPQNSSLFDLRQMKDLKKVPQEFVKADEVDEDYSSDEEEEDGAHDFSDASDGNDSDSDYDRLNEIEANLDNMYDEYMQKQIAKDPKLLIKKKRAQEEEFTEFKGSDSDSDNDDDDTASIKSESEASLSGEMSEDFQDESVIEKEEVQPVVKTKSDLIREKNASMFFKNSIFDDADIDQSESEPEVLDEELASSSKQKKLKGAQCSKIQQELSEGEDDQDQEELKVREREQKAEQIRKILDSPQAVQIAIEMIQDGGRKKEDVLEDYGYTRYSNFGLDDDSLPSWFKDDELRFNQPVRHQDVTKEAVQIYKDRQKALNQKPIKKVAEAKARKKYKSTKKLDKLKQKMNAMLDDDLNDSSKSAAQSGYDPEMATKLSEMQKMLRNAARKSKESQKRKVELVVAKGNNRGKKGRPSGVKGRYKMVDPRMKKELKAVKRKERETKRKRK
ncbi:hypothetical protein MP228_012532 [Amoeboaphelidium protococcarum]|nr:hypothetical protein MP228_012532 [Amoeboaphelidium protococcarum]